MVHLQNIVINMGDYKLESDHIVKEVNWEGDVVVEIEGIQTNKYRSEIHPQVICVRAQICGKRFLALNRFLELLNNVKGVM